jgi:hypothetical protein
MRWDGGWVALGSGLGMIRLAGWRSLSIERLSGVQGKGKGIGYDEARTESYDKLDIKGSRLISASEMLN